MPITRNADSNKDGHVFKLPAPATFQENAVHVHVRIGFTFQGAVTPFFYVFISFLVKIAYGTWRDFGSPQRLGNVLHSTHGHACQIHFYQRLFHGCFAAFVAFYDSCFKGKSLELWDAKIYVSRSGRKVTIIVSGTITLPFLVTSVTLGIHQAVGFGIKKRIKGLFDAVPYKIL